MRAAHYLRAMINVVHLQYCNTNNAYNKISDGLVLLNIFYSCSSNKGSEPATRGATGYRRPAGVLRGSLPQHDQLLDQEQRGDAVGWVGILSRLKVDSLSQRGSRLRGSSLN